MIANLYAIAMSKDLTALNTRNPVIHMIFHNESTGWHSYRCHLHNPHDSKWPTTAFVLDRPDIWIARASPRRERARKSH